MIDREKQFKVVTVTGGAGYVGACLVPKLLDEGYDVKVLDLYIYGDHVLDSVKNHPRLQQIKGDLRNIDLVRSTLEGSDAVIHLACISNDPSFELNPELGKSINYDAFIPLVNLSKRARVKRFIYASTSSVYGIKEVKNVTEDLPLEPLTDYSKYKALCEDILLQERKPGFEVLILRPATVCGYSPRLRLDLTVNILTNHAIHQGVIKVLGGNQTRPNIHMEDVCALYLKALTWPSEKIDGQIFNAGYQNHTVSEIAQMVKNVLGDHINIETVPSNDNRSYHISSEKIKRMLDFVPRFTLEDAIRDLAGAFRTGKIKDAMTDERYYNIKMMQKLQLP